MNYYTSDLHFNHKNIIKHCHRPFYNIKNMNDTIINNFNQILKPKDSLYILGDLGWEMKNCESIANLVAQIKCKKILITGNHDKDIIKKEELRNQFKEIYDMYSLKDGDYNITLCHYPMLVWNKSNKGSYHFYGHIHKHTLEHTAKNSFNVGVDVCNFKPLTAKQIIKSK